MSMEPIRRVAVLDRPEQVAALGHPLRVALLAALREPTSAAGAARLIGEPRQKVNHHVKALLDAGMIRPAGERRTGNFVEQLYVALAGSFVVSSRLTWGDGARDDALAGQLPLEHLVVLGDRVQRDAAALLDRAAFDGEDIAAVAVDADVTFPDEAARADFLAAYVASVRDLVAEHGGRGGPVYRVALAAYPDPEEQS
jgi:DNA-binding transcriptional ArsR family regulator